MADTVLIMPVKLFRFLLLFICFRNKALGESVLLTLLSYFCCRFESMNFYLTSGGMLILSFMPTVEFNADGSLLSNSYEVL